MIATRRVAMSARCQRGLVGVVFRRARHGPLESLDDLVEAVQLKLRDQCCGGR
jgi:hypothetical protein